MGIKTDGTIVMAGDCEKPLDSEDDSHMYLDEVKNVLENIDNAHHFSSTWWYIIDNDGNIISIVPSLFPDYPEFKDVEDIVYSFDEHDHIYILAAGTIRPIKLEDGNPCTESCYVCQEMFLPDTYVGLAITNTDLITLNYRGIIESHSTYESGFKIIKFPENTRCKLP